jgi:hypothetical protein
MARSNFQSFFRRHKVLKVLLAAIVTYAAWYFLSAIIGDLILPSAAPYTLNLQHVSAYRLGELGIKAGKAWDDPNLIGRRVVTATISPVSKDVVASVVAALNAHSTYSRFWPPDLCFNPGLAFRLGDGPDQVEVQICLDCDRVLFVHGDQSQMADLSLIGHWKLDRIYHRLFASTTAD